VNLEARREYAANAIVEDARLRGELTDEQYEPIQAEALAYVDAAAQKTGRMGEEKARRLIDQAVTEAKERIRARVTEVQTESESALTRLLRRLRR
jgi:hypothetical protein